MATGAATAIEAMVAMGASAAMIAMTAAPIVMVVAMTETATTVDRRHGARRRAGTAAARPLAATRALLFPTTALQSLCNLRSCVFARPQVLCLCTLVSFPNLLASLSCNRLLTAWVIQYAGKELNTSGLRCLPDRTD